MADGISLTLTPAKDFEKELDPATYEITMVEALEEIVRFLQGEIISRTPMDTGNARGRIFSGIAVSGLNPVGEVYSNDVQVATLEEGRRVGAAMPPVDAIAPWVSSHLGDESLSYVVARAISQRGLPAHHMFAEVAEKYADEIASRFMDIVFKSAK